MGMVSEINAAAVFFPITVANGIGAFSSADFTRALLIVFARMGTFTIFASTLLSCGLLFVRLFSMFHSLYSNGMV